MKVIFAGTPAMVLPCLEALHQSEGIELVGVVSRADTKARRGMKMQASAVKSYALKHQIDVITPLSLKQDEESLLWLQQKKADVLIVVAYGLILPESWLTAATFGAVNLHASLLPRWRGAAPIERALLAGDAETGVCVMAMDQGLDTGAVYSRCVVPIETDTTTVSLRDTLMNQGAELLVESLKDIVDATLIAEPQPDEGTSYAHKITNDERIIDWQKSATLVGRQVRTFTPKPGARTMLQGKWLKIISGEVIAQNSNLNCGDVLLEKNTFDVGCLDSTYRVTQVQPEGKRVMAVQDFMRGLQQTKELKV
ncbi:MAG: methionyl-tRNA formyltransferase [Mariprofundaceae bacterium]|nr:methionyl-tRNA formyltransferase [Mariprofundaceae bacterium]